MRRSDGAEYHLVSGSIGRSDDVLGDLGVEAVADVDRDAEVMRAAGGHQRGGPVDPVAEFVCGREYALASLGAGPGGVAEDQRHQRLGHPDLVGDVLHGRSIAIPRHVHLFRNRPAGVDSRV